MSIHVYHAAHLPVWADSPDNAEQAILSAWLKRGLHAYFANVWAQLEVLDVQGLLLPVALPENHRDNSYVCSPTAHYIHYARRELELELAHEVLFKGSIDLLLRVLGRLFSQWDFEKVVYVNNWMLSTNLYPDLPLSVIPDLHRVLLQRYPGRALVFRSLNPVHHPTLIQSLKRLGYHPVFNRQVYLFDSEQAQASRAFKKDRRLARKSPYAWAAAESIETREISRLHQLYQQLYIGKYSPLNPQFTELFFREALQQNWLRFRVLRHQETHQIEAVVAYTQRNGIMTAPIIGYNPELPPQTGLYRLISLFLADESQRNNWQLNRSSGASQFKRLRGNRPVFEHNWVYTEHLPRSQRLPWQSLTTLSGSCIEPVMRHFEL